VNQLDELHHSKLIYVLPTSIRYREKIKDLRWSRILTMPPILVLPIMERMELENNLYKISV